MESTKIFRIFGIDIKLHFSWWIILILLTWILSTSFFPEYLPGETVANYWFMGFMASLLLFVSVLLHELSHSLVAKARKIKVESITLFFFGGVAGITKEDIKPSSEFLMAIAGPIFSLFLTGIFFLIYQLNGSSIWTAITFYLYQLNLTLAIFNMIPGFPLDGGRALRAILYWRCKDLKKATSIASKGGKIFAVVLIVLGMTGLLSGQGSGLWLVVLGGFLYFIAGAAYEQVVIKEALENIKVKELLNKDIPTIKPDTKFSELIQQYSNSEETLFLVKDSTFSGLLDTKSIARIPLKLQPLTLAKQLAVPLKQIKSLKREDNCYTAFQKLAEEKIEALPVFNNSQLEGFITKKRLMHKLVWQLKFGSSVKISKSVKNQKITKNKLTKINEFK